MMISNADWKNYIEKLSSLDKTAGDLMLKWVQKNGFSDSEALTDYAYALVTKYGEGSAALAAEMYDAVAEMSGKFYPPAETAPTPDYEDVAKAVNGTRRWSQNEKAVPNTVSRMVKQAGADTTLRNAIRDQAEFAWVPNGDTCAFCITLASNGWQPASNAVAKGGHAEHIHPNCDCTFAIRFDGKGGVKGYDPEKYKRMYDEAEGGNSKEKINSIRRMKYAENPEKYRAQSRAAYAERRNKSSREFDNTEFIKLSRDGNTFVVRSEALHEYARNIPKYKDYTDIVVHGDAYGVSFKDANGIDHPVNPAEFAEIIEKGGHYEGGRIRLISCNTGEDPALAPQYLANHFGVEVLAPTEAVFIDRNGSLIVANDEKDAIMGIETGSWRSFYPER